MNARSTIRKIVFAAVWLCIGGGMVSLLLAAISARNNEVCKSYSIVINKGKEHFFLNEEDVRQLLIKIAGNKLTGTTIASFRLHEMESGLEAYNWIEDAELYFDNRQVLHVAVRENIPVARVYSNETNSFYLDANGKKLPLSEKRTARVMVFTGFPDNSTWNVSDSNLAKDIAKVASFIDTSNFWKAQVAQMDMDASGNITMIPVVGNHQVKMGNFKDVFKKFRRLQIFYREVLSKTGFNKYKNIDVQYKGQVVVSNINGSPLIDSVEYRKKVEALIEQTRPDTEKTEVKYSDVKSTAVKAKQIVEKEVSQKIEKAVSSDENLKTEKKQIKTEGKEKKVPKAVMPSRETPEEDPENGY